MGFKYLSGKGGAYLGVDGPGSPQNQLDAVAFDEDVIVSIECKYVAAPRRLSDFAAVLAKHASSRKPLARAVQEQYPSTEKRGLVSALWMSGVIVGDNDRARAVAENVRLLDSADLDYYEALVSQIGPAARFQFLADLLEGQQIPGLEITVPAIRCKMGGTTGYTFSVSPEYLLKIAFVSHRARGKATDVDAYQRMLKKSRLRDIREYISQGGIFPTSLVVNIRSHRWLTFDRGEQKSDGAETTFGWLHIRPAYRVAWIIDGQHRLFAYAGHPLAAKSLVSVMAFVGLPSSEQARLFVDINAQQRKVKQSLLQELFAELHWDASDVEIRIQAIISKIVLALDGDLDSPLNGRVQKADDLRTHTRCITLTSIFRALERGGFFVTSSKKGQVLEYGPLWDSDNQATVRRASEVLKAYFRIVSAEAACVWERGAGPGGGLAMNDGVTVCVNVLGKVLEHLRVTRGIPLVQLSTAEVCELVEPFAMTVGRHFGSLSAEQVEAFRRLRGVQGQTAGTRQVEVALQRYDATFNPPGLSEYLERQKTQTTTRAFQAIHRIEEVLQAMVISELRSEFGDEETAWFFNGVPMKVRKKVDDRINEEGGKKGGRAENFDLIDYRDVVLQNWVLFERLLGKGKGSKETRTTWLAEVNELRKHVMHASKGLTLPVTEEQLFFLEDVVDWLESASGNDNPGSTPTTE